MQRAIRLFIHSFSRPAYPDGGVAEAAARVGASKHLGSSATKAKCSAGMSRRDQLRSPT